MVPDILDEKYEIKQEIASGAMGAVYLAFHKTLRREVAIKAPHPHFSSDPAFVERFLREARAMARLDHQNIIRVFDVLLIDERPYIVMEYFQGENLKQHLYNSGCYSPNEVVNIATQIANGLSYAHSLGIIHRDIKPANIMVDKFGIAKLADFGIAAAVGEAGLTSTGEVIGTPQYMSPEQARGLALDFRTDIYSLGIVLYQLLSAKTPLDAISTVAIIGKLAYEDNEFELDFPENTPAPLKQLICSMIIKNRDQRVQNTQDICFRLYEMLPQEKRSTLSTMSYFESGDDKTVIQPRMQPSRDRSADVTVVASPQTSTVETNSSSKGIVVFLSIMLLLGSGVAFYFLQLAPKPEVNIKSAQETDVVKTPTLQTVQPLEVPSEKIEKVIPQVDEKIIANQQLENQLNSKLNELIQLKTQAIRNENRLNKDSVRKWASGDLVEANASLSLAAKLESEALNLKSSGLLEQAIMSSEEAVKELVSANRYFDLASEKSVALSKQAKRLQTVRGKLDKIMQQALQAKREAEESNAEKLAASEFVEGGRLFSASQKLLKQGDQSFEELNLNAAEESYQQVEIKFAEAKQKFNDANQLAKVARENAVPQAASKKDIASVSNLLQNIEKSIEGRDINTLTQLSIDSSDKLEFFKQLFSIYQTLEVSIKDFSINSRQSIAKVSIDRLVKSNGDITIPSTAWKDTRLIIEKSANGWEKVRMPVE